MAEDKKILIIDENPYQRNHLSSFLRRKSFFTDEASSFNEAANKLLLPDILTTAILAYRDQVIEDPEAPAHLGELLDMWDPCSPSAHIEEDDWYDEEFENENDW